MQATSAFAAAHTQPPSATLPFLFLPLLLSVDSAPILLPPSVLPQLQPPTLPPLELAPQPLAEPQPPTVPQTLSLSAESIRRTARRAPGLQVVVFSLSKLIPSDGILECNKGDAVEVLATSPGGTLSCRHPATGELGLVPEWAVAAEQDNSNDIQENYNNDDNYDNYNNYNNETPTTPSLDSASSPSSASPPSSPGPAGPVTSSGAPSARRVVPARVRNRACDAHYEPRRRRGVGVNLVRTQRARFLAAFGEAAEFREGLARLARRLGRAQPVAARTAVAAGLTPRVATVFSAAAYEEAARRVAAGGGSVSKGDEEAGGVDEGPDGCGGGGGGGSRGEGWRVWIGREAREALRFLRETGAFALAATRTGGQRRRGRRRASQAEFVELLLMLRAEQRESGGAGGAGELLEVVELDANAARRMQASVDMTTVGRFLYGSDAGSASE
ncbi:hypothetical protein HK405_008716 [Cladochytrium tenue]|nr:hypothetical protein HK405_008716 [Cladochytrium tenue]